MYHCKAGRNKFVCETLEEAAGYAAKQCGLSSKAVIDAYKRNGRFHNPDKSCYLDFIDVNDSISAAVDEFQKRWKTLAPIREEARHELKLARTITLFERVGREPWSTIKGDEAITSLEHWLFHWYMPSSDTPPQPERFASITGNLSLLDVYSRLNEWKREFNTWHAAFRELFVRHLSEYQASQNMRAVLRKCDAHDLDLDLADRTPFISQDALRRLTFNYKLHRSSRRATIADAVEFLKKRWEKAAMPYDAYQELSEKLKRYPPGKPVYQLLRKGVVRPYYRALPQGDTEAHTGMAHQPVFALHSQAGEIPIKLPERSPDDVQSELGPNIVSEELLNEYLSGWHLYKQDPQKSEGKKPKAQTPKRLPGLRLTSEGLVQIRLSDGRRRSFSVSRYGLEGAWKKAAEVYCSDRPGNDLETVLSLLADYR